MARTLSASEKKTIVRCVILLAPFVVFYLGVKPYSKALGDLRDQLQVERESLARERGAVETARRFPELKQMTDSAQQSLTPRLFEGADDVIATSELAAWLGDIAHRNHFWMQDAATRTATSLTQGVRTLHVEVRGESDVQGLLAFLQEIERGDKLVRIERLDVSRGMSSPDNEKAETLNISATVAGYAMGTASDPANKAIIPPRAPVVTQ